MKRRCLVIEVVGCPRADGGHPSNGHQNKCLLIEVKYAESDGDEVQAFEEEGLGWLEDRWNPHPNRWEYEKLQ